MNFFPIILIILFQTYLLAEDTMSAKQEKAFGTWPSPISAELVSQTTKAFGAVVIDQGVVYWEEMRPKEQGRTLVVSEKEGDITPPGYSVRTRVHEYGGKSFTVHQGTVYFVNDKDQRIHVQQGASVKPLTKEGVRFADPCYTPHGLIAVGEIHHGSQVDNFLALIDLHTGEYRTIASGFDFYSSPTPSPDGSQLAWLQWNLPNMPWDGTELWTADIKKTGLENARRIAGGDEESIFQPQWSPEGTLYYVSDKSGWWNIYRADENISPLEAEFGLPQWVFGRSTYSFVDDQILCTYFKNGIWSLALLDPETKQLNTLPVQGTFFTQIRSDGHTAVFMKGSAQSMSELIKMDLKTHREKILASNTQFNLDKEYFSIGQPVSYPSKGGRMAHAFYYPPANKDYQGLRGELPPLIVKVHGGPTSNVTSVFDPRIQFWTSRGFAFLDVNYGGSTGYGRAYRELLTKTWGIVDVDDCEAGARYLVSKGLADPKKIAITGGSAGGFTVLACLTHGNVFTVGGCYFGLSDLTVFFNETHKFEARYLDKLIGPLPDSAGLYKERSPVTKVDHIQAPVIFFQGLEDKIVPPNQSEIMYEALKKKGIPTKLIMYEGEGHGFRKAENIINSMNEELAFYLKVFYGKAGHDF